jgi:HD-GYP domain-containing protein (c-di-GMP phosphodiesterase class II)
VGSEHLGPEARILAVADVFDALTADRPYRRPLDPDVAFEILWKDAGAAFDPTYISALASSGVGVVDVAGAEAAAGVDLEVGILV